MWRMFSHLSVGTMGATNCSDVQRFLRDAFQGWLAMLAVFFHMMKNRFAAEFGQKVWAVASGGRAPEADYPKVTIYYPWACNKRHLLCSWISSKKKLSAIDIICPLIFVVNPAGLPQFNSPPGGGARIYPRNKGPKGPGRCLVFHHWQKFVFLIFGVKAWLFIQG